MKIIPDYIINYLIGFVAGFIVAVILVKTTPEKRRHGCHVEPPKPWPRMPATPPPPVPALSGHIARAQGIIKVDRRGLLYLDKFDA